MPEIIELPFDYSTLSLSEEDEFRTRSPGLHLTDITKAMLIEAGLSKWKTDPDPNKRLMQFQKGFLFERIIQRCLQVQMQRDIQLSGGLLYRPGEYSTDGVFCTPDAINLSTDNPWLEEWKATAISIKNLTRDNLFYEKPEWKWAAAWHCAHFNLDSVVFRIWHHREFDPTIKQYQASFTPDELRTNKEKLLNYAHYKGMLGAPSQT